MIGRDALLAWDGAQKIVLVAGMIRSGSTWLYNAVRMVCSAGPDPARAQGYWIDDFAPATVRASAWLIVKTHVPDPELASRSDLIITSRRDLRDVAASVRDMGWSNDPDDLPRFASDARNCDEFWTPKANLTLPYETIVHHAPEAVAAIAEALSATLGPDDQAKILQALSALESPAGEAGVYDKTTLLHPRHRVDGRPERWRSTLDPKIAAKITADNRDWLQACGYGV